MWDLLSRGWSFGSVFLLILCGSAVAQDATPVAATEETTAEGDLQALADDPFSVGPTLQARKLRGLNAEVAGLLMSSTPGGEIALEALATPLRADGEKVFTPLFVEIDGPTFLESNHRSVARIEIYAYALGAEQQVAGYLAEVFAVDVQELGEAVWQSGLKFFGHLNLPPGEYQLKVMIRNFHSGATGFREMALAIPSLAMLEQPFVLPIFQPPAKRDSWLPVREWAAPDEYPLWIDERAISPTVRPVLFAGRDSKAHLFVHGLPAGIPRGRIELTRAGAVIASSDLDITSAEPGTGGSPSLLGVSFETPAATEPGIYSLRVALGGGESTPTPVVVMQQGSRDRGLLWTDLRNQLSGNRIARAAPAAAPQKAEKKKQGRSAKREEQRRFQALASSYREALSLLGTNGNSAARSAMLDLESSVLTDGSMEDLKSAQLAVAENLGSHDVESLLPVLVLHDELYNTYRQRNLFSLGFHAREMIEQIAELYAEQGGTRGSHVVTARALASLGGHLQAANLPASSRRLYQRALEHDRTNTAALLGLAISFERYGDYTQTVEILEDLVEMHPDLGEGLLRLAINLDRLGVRSRARSLLERVLEADAPDWVRSLAFQKLARISVETGNLERAAQILELSLAEIPNQHGSIYLLAHIYDRQRQAYRALELLQSVAPATSMKYSARKLYDNWPEATLDLMRRQLSEAAEMRAGLVSELLEGASGK